MPIRLCKYRMKKFQQRVTRYLLSSKRADWVTVGRYLENYGDTHYDLPVFPYAFADKYSSLQVEVYVDDEDYPYVLHNGYKLFGPKEWSLEYMGEYYKSLLLEQDCESPHRYLRDDVVLTEDDVVADVGAAEGIFTLDIIDRVKKVYLFECEEKWIVPLQKTLARWDDKYELVRKYVADKTEGPCVTLDDFFAEREVTFVKADIEGAEIAMLRGAQRILKAKLQGMLICCYHNQDDEQTIKRLLDEQRYSYRDNEGYMLFMFFKKDRKEPYLRRGVLYAWNSERRDTTRDALC